MYSMQWAAAAGVPTEKDYPYPLPAATGICNPKVTKMKRAYTGGAVEVDLTSSQALFKVCAAVRRSNETECPGISTAINRRIESQ